MNTNETVQPPELSPVATDGETGSVGISNNSVLLDFETPEAEASYVASLRANQKHTFLRQGKFLAVYAATGDVNQACRAAPVSIRRYQEWKHDDVFEFETRFQLAHRVLCNEMESKLTELWRALRPGQNPLPLIVALNKNIPEYRQTAAGPADDNARELLLKLREMADGEARKPAPKKAEDAEAEFLATLGAVQPS